MDQLKIMNYRLIILLSFVGCLLLLLHVNQLVEAGQDIPMTKCCHGETFFYFQGFDSCGNESDESITWPPSLVYTTNLNLIDDITAEDFNITTSAMEGCPEGHIATSTEI